MRLSFHHMHTPLIQHKRFVIAARARSPVFGAQACCVSRWTERHTHTEETRQKVGDNIARETAQPLPAVCRCASWVCLHSCVVYIINSSSIIIVRGWSRRHAGLVWESGFCVARCWRNQRLAPFWGRWISCHTYGFSTNCASREALVFVGGCVHITYDTMCLWRYTIYNMRVWVCARGVSAVCSRHA